MYVCIVCSGRSPIGPPPPDLPLCLTDCTELAVTEHLLEPRSKRVGGGGGVGNPGRAGQGYKPRWNPSQVSIAGH
jgi:hypothetical protein